MGILYHISMDDSNKSLFVYTEPPAMAVLYDRLMAVPDVRREPELIALAVNLTQNARCAAALVEGPKFDRLMKRAMERRDDLLFKVMRNVSQVRMVCLQAPVSHRLQPHYTTQRGSICHIFFMFPVSLTRSKKQKKLSRAHSVGMCTAAALLVRRRNGTVWRLRPQFRRYSPVK